MGDTRTLKPEEVSLERWQSFAHRSIVYDEARKAKERAEQKELAEMRKTEAYKEAHPLNYFLDRL